MTQGHLTHPCVLHSQYDKIIGLDISLCSDSQQYIVSLTLFAVLSLMNPMACPIAIYEHIQI
jgi:hypothetical protein